MGTTHSVEELERLGAYGSHKRPRTLSRGSSADGSRNNNGIVRSRQVVLDLNETTKDRASANGHSVDVELHQHNHDTPGGDPSALAPAAVQETGKAEDQKEDLKAELRPVTVALMNSPLPQHRSRQRPRHPDTKPPAPDELRRLMDRSKAMKEELEAEESVELAIVESPHENDVLLGRGRRCTEHKGNIIFREFVRERREEYNKAWKYKKQEMAVEIVEKIKSLDPPGRFLELLNDGRWKEVTKKQSLEKASQAMREKKWSSEPPASSTTPPESAPRAVASVSLAGMFPYRLSDVLASSVTSSQRDATLERPVVEEKDGPSPYFQG